MLYDVLHEFPYDLLVEMADPGTGEGPLIITGNGGGGGATKLEGKSSFTPTKSGSRVGTNDFEVVLIWGTLVLAILKRAANSSYPFKGCGVRKVLLCIKGGGNTFLTNDFPILYPPPPQPLLMTS